VDNGNGVRAFKEPISLATLQAMIATQRANVQRKNVGTELVIQRTVPSMVLSPRLHKMDLRVYVCCDTRPEHRVYVYRRFGLREAPTPWDPSSLARDVQCTHGGKIQPASEADYPDYAVVFPRILDAVRAITDVLRSRWEAFKPEEMSAFTTVLYGVDFILDAKLHPYLLEVNQVPRLTYHDPVVQEWVESMAMDFVKFLVLPVLEGKAPEGAWCPV
jgi:hypothetical protein